jgi:Mu transposase, C-terminal domain
VEVGPGESHVEIAHHYYSVPHPLLHERLEARITATSVELFHRGQRVAAHARSFTCGRPATCAAHMPKAHQAHAEWSPSRFIRWGRTIGPQTAALVAAILADEPDANRG